MLVNDLNQKHLNCIRCRWWRRVLLWWEPGGVVGRANDVAATVALQMSELLNKFCAVVVWFHVLTQSGQFCTDYSIRRWHFSHVSFVWAQKGTLGFAGFLVPCNGILANEVSLIWTLSWIAVSTPFVTFSLPSMSVVMWWQIRNILDVITLNMVLPLQ